MLQVRHRLPSARPWTLVVWADCQDPPNGLRLIMTCWPYQGSLLTLAAARILTLSESRSPSHHLSQFCQAGYLLSPQTLRNWFVMSNIDSMPCIPIAFVYTYGRAGSRWASCTTGELRWLWCLLSLLLLRVGEAKQVENGRKHAHKW